MKLALVCSSGGHFLEMHFLKELWQRHERFWVTFLRKDTLPLLLGADRPAEVRVPDRRDRPVVGEERAYGAYWPTNRNTWNLARNFVLAWKILHRERPDAVISTGAGVAVPFVYVAKMMGITTVYIELETRVNDLSLTARLIYPVVDHLIVQWPELAAKSRKAIYQGHIV